MPAAAHGGEEYGYTGIETSGASPGREGRGRRAAEWHRINGGVH